MRKPANELLEAAYSALDFERGELLQAERSPANLTQERWVDKGDWLELAAHVGAERIFFVKDNPVIVFARLDVQSSETPRELFNKIWCMARPQRLFLATPGKLEVYDLTKAPVPTDKAWQENRPLAIVDDVAQVAQKLKDYHREILESGKLVGEEYFGSSQRADKALIEDLKAVRAQLTNPDPGLYQCLPKLPQKYAHALIGRSIFIRYLEDRGILIDEDFEEVAARNPEWQAILNQPAPKIEGRPSSSKNLYLKVLGNKDFTYALFEQLSRDFHGDMFPSDPDERKAVDAGHLLLLQSGLRGDVGPQQNLFFWAYKFDIIPIELISSIYEEFYQTLNADNDTKGTHYTPSSLVQFLLAKVLTPKCLQKNPRIIDPCCGSGIFLVEAFRRIVRYRVHQQGRSLTSSELRAIIRDQIAGIEINEEAIRIAAFSLYLALLHFQEPPAIRKQIEMGQRLPSLVYQAPSEPLSLFQVHNQADEQFNNLLEANAFDIEEKTRDQEVLQNFGSACADVVVGNPPWGKSNLNDKATQKLLHWCSQNNYPVGDKERSQAFIWRTLDLLREDGFAGLLVSTGIFFKHHRKSREFRKRWLKSIQLEEVVNFSHVREIFFNKAISPFASIVFQKRSDADPRHQLVNYYSAKKTAQAVTLQAVVLSNIDLQRIIQRELLLDDRLWKVYWWGSHKDYALIRVMEFNLPLRDLCDLQNTGRGYEKREGSQSSNKIRRFKVLPPKGLGRYGALDSRKLQEVPERVGRLGKSQELYSGKRIIVKRGITQEVLPKGQIIARFESTSFCFKHSIYGIKLVEPEDWTYKVVLAILWSSLARYYFFLTASTWGLWHHEIHLTELLSLPICLPESQQQAAPILKIVDQLKRANPRSQRAANAHDDIEQLNFLDQLDKPVDNIALLEYQLDEAIFDLYGLRESDRDLVRDLCNIGIEFFYNHAKSRAVRPVITSTSSPQFGLLHDLQATAVSENGFKNYLGAFLKTWNREVLPASEFSWRIILSDSGATMACIVFSTQKRGNRPQKVDGKDQSAWAQVLKQLDDSALISYNSNRVYIDGMIRVVTDTDIIIIKRNEMRLWTKSMAREDAEATLLQAINLQQFHGVST